MNIINKALEGINRIDLAKMANNEKDLTALKKVFEQELSTLKPANTAKNIADEKIISAIMKVLKETLQAIKQSDQPTALNKNLPSSEPLSKEEILAEIKKNLAQALTKIKGDTSTDKIEQQRTPHDDKLHLATRILEKGLVSEKANARTDLTDKKTQPDAELFALLNTQRQMMPDPKPDSSTKETVLQPKLVENIVEKILVTDTRYQNDNEVRIFIKDTVMSSTQIQIQKIGDTIQVEFLTASAQVQELLDRKKGELKTHLDNTLNAKIKVQVTFDPNQNQGENEGFSGSSYQDDDTNH